MNIRVDIAYQQQVILTAKTFCTCISMAKKKKDIWIVSRLPEKYQVEESLR